MHDSNQQGLKITVTQWPVAIRKFPAGDNFPLNPYEIEFSFISQPKYLPSYQIFQYFEALIINIARYLQSFFSIFIC